MFPTDADNFPIIFFYVVIVEKVREGLTYSIKLSLTNLFTILEKWQGQRVVQPMTEGSLQLSASINNR